MKRIIFTLAAIAGIAAGVSAQSTRPQKVTELRTLKAEERRIKSRLDEIDARTTQLVTSLMQISDADRAEALRFGGDAHRLFPDGILDEFNPTPDTFGFSILSLNELAEYYFAPRLEYAGGNLRIRIEGLVHGYLFDLGQIPYEAVTSQNREVIALSKLKPAPRGGESKLDVTVDGFTFTRRVPATVGNTYLIRGISPGAGDGIVVIKIQRKDSDESIVVFTRLLEKFDPSQPNRPDSPDEPKRPTDEELYQSVQNSLIGAGLVNVSVRVSAGIVTLYGSVPKGRSGEAVRLAINSKPVRVENQITEEP